MHIARWTYLWAIVAAPAAAAQVVHTGRTGAAAGTVATVAPAPPVIIIVPAQQLVFAPGTLFAPGTVFFRNLPVTILADGRVFANFGTGFERILRTCSEVAAQAFLRQPHIGQPVVVQPIPGLTTAQPVPATQIVPVVSFVTQPAVLQPVPGLPTNQPIPYTQIVPSQSTPSQQMLQQQILGGQPIAANTQACWAATVNGQVVVARP